MSSLGCADSQPTLQTIALAVADSLVTPSKDLYP